MSPYVDKRLKSVTGVASATTDLRLPSQP